MKNLQSTAAVPLYCKTARGMTKAPQRQRSEIDWKWGSRRESESLVHQKKKRKKNSPVGRFSSCLRYWMPLAEISFLDPKLKTIVWLTEIQQKRRERHYLVDEFVNQRCKPSYGYTKGASTFSNKHRRKYIWIEIHQVIFNFFYFSHTIWSSNTLWIVQKKKFHYILKHPAYIMILTISPPHLLLSSNPPFLATQANIYKTQKTYVVTTETEISQHWSTSWSDAESNDFRSAISTKHDSSSFIKH